MLAIFIFRNKSRYVLLSSDSVGFIGTKSIPQIGQDPGPSCIISGCMGQVYGFGRYQIRCFYQIHSANRTIACFVIYFSSSQCMDSSIFLLRFWYIIIFLDMLVVSLLCWRSLPPQQDFVTDSSILLSDPMWVYSFQ
jgi:hypothetical protein